MNASKENARKAYNHFRRLLSDYVVVGGQVRIPQESKDFVKDFLTAAERKLPSEAAYDRSKKRAAPRLTNRGGPVVS